ncbi:MAG: hypothetical protein MJ175_08220, partial [Clostridia bacterium]|nr:hypothetical protein [Clostridia bacterium]
IFSHKNTDVFTPDWERASADQIADTASLPYAFMVRMETSASYDAACSAVKAAVPGTEILTAGEDFSGKLAFLTPVTTEKTLKASLSDCGTMVSMIRVLA